MTELFIENIIATTHLHKDLPLDTLVEAFPDATYNAEEQPVLIIRFQTPKRAVFVLSDGQLFCTGSTSLDTAEKTIKLVLDELKQKGISFDTDIPVEIHTITASSHLTQTVQLQLIKDALQDETVIYNPDHDPWLEYQPVKHVTVLIFPSGKLVLTGNASLEEMKEILNSLKNTLTLKGII